MSQTTSVPKEQTLKPEDEHRSYLKPLMANQPRTSSYRSFGRELINIDSKTETSMDASKNIVQTSHLNILLYCIDTNHTDI